MLLAGGGVKGGAVYGASDELGMHVAENPVHVHDFHVTILHLLGLDHEKLTYRYTGRDFRLGSGLPLRRNRLSAPMPTGALSPI